MPLCSIILLFIVILLVIVYYRSRIEGFKCISHVNIGDILRDCKEPKLTLCDSKYLCL